MFFTSMVRPVQAHNSKTIQNSAKTK